jgi:hypothetical protein
MANHGLTAHMTLIGAVQDTSGIMRTLSEITENDRGVISGLIWQLDNHRTYTLNKHKNVSQIAFINIIHRILWTQLWYLDYKRQVMISDTDMRALHDVDAKYIRDVAVFEVPQLNEPYLSMFTSRHPDAESDYSVQTALAGIDYFHEQWKQSFLQERGNDFTIKTMWIQPFNPKLETHLYGAVQTQPLTAMVKEPATAFEKLLAEEHRHDPEDEHIWRDAETNSPPPDMNVNPQVFRGRQKQLRRRRSSLERTVDALDRVSGALDLEGDSVETKLYLDMFNYVLLDTKTEDRTEAEQAEYQKVFDRYEAIVLSITHIKRRHADPSLKVLLRGYNLTMPELKEYAKLQRTLAWLDVILAVYKAMPQIRAGRAGSAEAKFAKRIWSNITPDWMRRLLGRHPKHDFSLVLPPMPSSSAEQARLITNYRVVVARDILGNPYNKEDYISALRDADESYTAWVADGRSKSARYSLRRDNEVGDIHHSRRASVSSGMSARRRSSSSEKLGFAVGNVVGKTKRLQPRAMTRSSSSGSGSSSSSSSPPHRRAATVGSRGSSTDGSSTDGE